jgi:hypothetical protein
VNNNFDLDFTELGAPHGSKPGQAAPKAQGTEKQVELITIGFSVKPKEKAIIQDHVNRMHSQFVVDPTNERTEENVRLPR